MKSLVLSQWDLPLLPTIALLIFISLFVGVLWWVTREKNKSTYEEIKFLPLKEGNNHE